MMGTVRGKKPYLFDLDPGALRGLMEEWGLRPYRAEQILDWVYRKGVTDPERMTNLSKADRALVGERLSFHSGRVVGHQVASDGTQKLLLEWDEHLVRPGKRASLSVLPAEASRTECVLIPAQDPRGARRTACVSSQVGCAVGCRFCASGLGGLDGNLTAGQIVEQVWWLAALPGVGRVTHVVFMGMGEPLANFDQVVRAIRTLMAPWGLGISGRRITVSTVGLPHPIRRLADLDLPVTLAVSLHAPNDEIRRQIIPWAEFVSIDRLIAAGREYFEKTGREVTLEYVLLHGVNDRPEHARELVEVCRKLRSHVNLIRYNEVEGLPFERPRDREVRRFQEILRRAGVNVHIRASRGRDIAAACGQLRHEGVAEAALAR